MVRASIRFGLGFGLVAALLLAACGGPNGGTGSSTTSGGSSSGGGGGGCPNDLPASCPTPAPGYARDVAPILKDRCLQCHAPGGVSANRPLDGYAAVYSRRGSVLDQIHACKMPLAGATPLSGAERAALLGWLVCGAPDD